MRRASPERLARAPPSERAPPSPRAVPDSCGLIFRDPFKIAVPKPGGGTTWVAYTCELHQDGTFQARP